MHIVNLSVGNANLINREKKYSDSQKYIMAIQRHFLLIMDLELFLNYKFIRDIKEYLSLLEIILAYNLNLPKQVIH